MRLSGEEIFTQDPQTIYNRLNDMQFMSQTIPGMQKVEETQPGRMVVKVKPGFSFIAGTLTLTMETSNQRPNEALTVQVKGKGIGASVVVKTDILLAPEGNGTKLSWTAEVLERTGLLKPVPQGLIEGAASKIVNDLWESFRQKL